MDVLIEAGLYRFGGLYDEKAAVTDVTYDSKETKEGTLFFCKGAAFKPAYLEEAVRRGAVCYVSEEAYPDEMCIRDSITTAYSTKNIPASRSNPFWKA